MQTIAVSNAKGGTGKTSAAVNLAAAWGAAGVRVLVLDLDPQRSATAWLGVSDDGAGLLDVFAGKGALAEHVRESVAPGVRVIPGSPALAGLERALAGKVGAELALRRAVARLGDAADVLVIDCPPTLGLLTVSALAAADGVLMPVEASSMAVAAAAVTEQLVRDVAEAYAPGLRLWAVLAGRVQEHTRIGREAVAALRERYGALVLRTVIHESVRLREAWGFGQPVNVYAPHSTAAQDFDQAAAELTRRLRRQGA